MAPNGGHLLVGKTVRLLRLAFDKAGRVLRDKLPQVVQPFEANAEPVYARITTKQPISRLAAIRQAQGRFINTQSGQNRYFSSSAQKASGSLRSSYPSSRTATRVAQLTSRAPFASTLRPNLTGGTLSRTAGGYALNAGRVNGARYFSHGPASPAEVIQNVSQAVRAFWISGQKARFNGYDPKTGEKRFRAVSELQDKARHQLDISSANALGSFVDFKVTPTITAIGPLSSIQRSPAASCDTGAFCPEHHSIANQTVLTTLELDFARALKDLAAVMGDLRRLSTLGSLPLLLVDPYTLRVKFPGCDRDTVENICRELNIRRGIVGQDPDFDEKCGTEMALLFPFAPSEPSEPDYKVVFENQSHRPTKRLKRQRIDWQAMMSPVQSVTPGIIPKSDSAHDILEDVEFVDNPWLSSPSGYSSLHMTDEQGEDVAAMFFQPARPSKQYLHDNRQSHASKYEGVEGIYRFLEECDGARC